MGYVGKQPSRMQGQRLFEVMWGNQQFSVGTRKKIYAWGAIMRALALTPLLESS
jgi:hypothetical protein